MLFGLFRPIFVPQTYSVFNIFLLHCNDHALNRILQNLR
eukprot:UN14867